MEETTDDNSPESGRIWDSVSEGRAIYNGAWGEGASNPEVTALISEDSGPKRQMLASSYPHLTHANANRGEHVTSSRVVDDRHPDYLIHQRYSQDNVKGSQPMHDRFFAVDRDNGLVRTATAKLIGSTREKHVPGKLAVPERKAPLGNVQDMRQYFVFEVGNTIDDKHPPLSPRSRDRK